MIGVYVEDFRDGRAFARAVAEAGKPVLLITGGISEAGVRAARSHTGALVSDSVAVDAACAAAGIIRVATPRELAERAYLLLAGNLPRGRRMRDRHGRRRLRRDRRRPRSPARARVAAALERAFDELAAVMPPTAGTTNPVDFAGAGEQDLRSYERIPRLLLESGEVDALVLSGYIGGYSVTAEELRAGETEAARGLAQVAADTGRTVVVQTMYWQESPAVALREGGVAVYRDIQAALDSLARRGPVGEQSPTGVPDLPHPAEPLRPDGYLEARELLANGGVPLAPALTVATSDEAVAAAVELGYPVVLKALGLVHKSDAGGVALGLANGEELERAFAGMAHLRAPGYVVERMVEAPGAVELIVGCRPGRPLRAGAARRARRRTGRGAPRHRRRAGADRGRRRRAPPARAARRAAAHRCARRDRRSPSARPPRPPRRSRGSLPHIRSWPSWRSTRCSSRPTRRSAWTPGPCSCAADRSHERRALRDDRIAASPTRASLVDPEERPDGLGEVEAFAGAGPAGAVVDFEAVVRVEESVGVAARQARGGCDQSAAAGT